MPVRSYYSITPETLTHRVIIMSVEIIAASVTFLVSIVALHFLRGPADIDYHKKVANELEASSTISFIIGVVGSLIVSVWIRMPAIIVTVLVGLCLGIGLHLLCLLYSSHLMSKKKEYSRSQQQVIDLATKIRRRTFHFTSNNRIRGRIEIGL